MPFHCPECGFEFPERLAQMPSQCPRCGAPLPIPDAPLAEPEPQQRHSYAFLRYSPTAWIIAANVVMFLVSLAMSHSLELSSESLLRLGANYGPAVLSGQWWRLFTSMFLHGGFLHIAFNMWALFNIGLLGEVLYGRRNFVILYLLCGIGGSILSVWWRFDVLGVGASGAIFGVAGALVPALKFQKNPRVAAAFRGTLSSITAFIVYNLLFGAAVPHIDNAAHLGGLLTGMLGGYLLPSYTVREERSQTGRTIAVFAVLAILLCGFALWAQQRGQAALDLNKGQVAINQGNPDQAIQYFRSALNKKPGWEQARFMLAATLFDQKRYSEALPHWQELVKSHPDVPKWQDTLCSLLIQTSKPEEALTHCNQAVQLEPQNGDYQFDLGLVYRTLGQNAMALDAFQRAQQISPDAFDENYYLGLSLIENGRKADATQFLQRAVELNPKDEAAKQALAESLQK